MILGSRESEGECEVEHRCSHARGDEQTVAGVERVGKSIGRSLDMILHIRCRIPGYVGEDFEGILLFRCKEKDACFHDGK